MSHQRKNSSKGKWPTWLKECLRRLTPLKRMTVSQWADEHRILDEKTSAQPGRWKTSMTPYLEGIMDAFNDQNIEEISFCKPTQVGGTEALQNTLGYIVAQEPAPTMVVYPTEKLAEFTSENRIQPMLDLSPVLKEKYHIRNSKKLELQFDGMYVVLSGANSPASLASRPIKNLLLDEVDKFPATSGKEADPINLARERTKTFPFNRKIVMASTPTIKSGNIWQAVERAHEVRKYFVPCPHCGHYQTFELKHIHWPKDVRDPEDVRDLAKYVCPECSVIITDNHKLTMLRTGEWRPVEKRSANPTKVAFHINTIYSPWVRFGDVAAKFLETKDYPDEFKNFINSWLAEPWEEASVKVHADIVLERQTEYEEGVVPAGTILLTGGVDVQENKLYWTIRAWGTHLTSQNIAHGECLSFDDIEVIMNNAYHCADGRRYQVNLCAIDSGDQTEDVYDFCAVNADWAIPVKGSSVPLLSRYRLSKIDKINSKAYGMNLVIVDGNQYKTMIASRLNRPNGKGSWMVFKGCDQEYAEQVTAEQKVKEKRGGREVDVWKPKTTRAPNHYLDCEVYCAAAADLLHVRYLSEEDKSEPEKPKENTTNKEPDQSGENNWLEPKGRWL